jgi:hypothetical protein
MVTHSSTDIVERLRDRDALAMSGLYYAIPAMIDAALEIERLRASLTTASGEAKQAELVGLLMTIGTADLFNALTRRVKYAGRDMGSITLGEMERAIDGAKLP